LGAARKRIVDALIGLSLALGSYVILYTINPELVRFDGLQLTPVTTNIYEESLSTDEAEHVGTSADNTLPSGACGEGSVQYTDVGGATGITGFSKVNVVTADSYKAVAAELYKRTAFLPGGPYKIKGTGQRPTGNRGDYAKCKGKSHSGECRDSGWSQAYKWEAKCLGKKECEGAPICNPFGWDNISKDANGLLALDPGACASGDRCPHTSGSAVDVTCTSPKFETWFAKQYGKDKKGKDKKPAAESPFYVPCQLALEQIMLEKGWCRLLSEAWHFENPNKSGAKACSSTLSAILGKQSGGHAYSSCNGVYELSTKKCVPIDF
jgi:hypothetical protein